MFTQETKVKNKPEYDDKPLHFGYTLGLNVMDFSFKRNYIKDPDVYVDIPAKALGFQVGMVGDMRLGEYLNLRVQPGFIFGQRDFYFIQRYEKVDSIHKAKIESSMLDLPILMKFRSKRVNNFRPYFIGGVSARYDLASKDDYDSDVKEYILLKPLDFYVEMGFGIDFYLPYFKLATELKLSLGLLDVLNYELNNNKYPKYLNSLQGLKSNLIMFSIHIE